MGRVIACGLGPGGPDLVTTDTRSLLASDRPVWLRTARHPAALLVPDAPTFDEVYERADTFADVYAEIADRLIGLGDRHGEVVYAVPGSPRVLERTVDLLAARAAAGELELDVRPALSFLDLAWVRLGVDPLEDGVRLIDGHRFAETAAGERGPLLVAHCHNRRVLSDIKLAVEDGPTEPVLVVQRLGLPDEVIIPVAWEDLDRTVEPDHLTSLYIPTLAAPVASEVVAFAELVRTLREQCPWDREQTHVTLTRHALEEAYEVVEAITAWAAIAGAPEADPDALADADEHLAEELGDLLFQVVFHATLGAERGAFDLADVARGINEKLVRRHPHVFAEDGSLRRSAGASPAADDLVATWEEIKRAERGSSSVMDGLPDDLPSLLWAHKVLRKAEAAGHAWDPATAEPDDLGDRLLALVAVARASDVDPETALRTAAARVRDDVRAAGA